MDVSRLCIKCMQEKAQPGGVCEHCGYNQEQDSVPSHHLEPLTILNGKYLVGRALGEGGFGITYIGLELNLEMRVAIKEYYPNGCASRDRNGTNIVLSNSADQKGQFESGREKFINEAKVLARCIHLPEIVAVKDFFYENETAYIVMEYIDGITLKTFLRQRGGRISVEETLEMMRPVIKSLEEVHRMNLIHRDISPDNIMLTKTGDVKVLDFGGARDFAGAGGKSLSIMLKPGYAPEEQYRTHGEQGPWTDVYAMCATIYRCITGEIPPEALERTYDDTLRPLSAFGVVVPGNIEYAINCGLTVYKNGRFQSMEQLYAALYGPESAAPHEFQSGNIIQEPISRSGFSQEPFSRSGQSQNGYSQNGYSQNGYSQIGYSQNGNSQAYYQPPQENTNINKILKIVIGVAGGTLLALLLLLAVKGMVSHTDADSAQETEETQAATETTGMTELAAAQASTMTEAEPVETETETQARPSAVKNIDMSYVSSMLNSYNTGANFSVYVYDLYTDEESGTYNYQEALPSSALISIPILYTTADLIERGYLTLDETRTFEYTYANGRGTLTAARNGKQVTIRELLESMLTYSDNNAINTMIDVLTLKTINKTCRKAGYKSVNMERKIIKGSSPKNNYASAQDLALLVRDLYNNKFSVINRDYILQYMRIEDKSAREGIFQSESLYNHGDYCSQNGTIPNKTGGRYCEMGIVFADDQQYIMVALADGGDGTKSPSAIGNAASYIHSCMTMQ